MENLSVIPIADDKYTHPPRVIVGIFFFWGGELQSVLENFWEKKKTMSPTGSTEEHNQLDNSIQEMV